ncbi:hypothetical protein Hamer_G012381 [Homarus americanus]|uniref:MARVEL domain-containing protein n=1 Tax=Homarus americanus TaxID=6706 RepID=A0A8J5KLQ5_HOMAM|nr:hypothetical protein Hamer_G012381 [Homarus americanus]
MVAAMLITPLLFVFYVTGSRSHQQTIWLIFSPSQELAINFLFFSFLFISASVSMSFWHQPTYWKDYKAAGISMGVFLYISSAAYLVDTVLASKNYCCQPKQN